jgi:hypothetical protein
LKPDPDSGTSAEAPSATDAVPKVRVGTPVALDVDEVDEVVEVEVAEAELVEAEVVKVEVVAINVLEIVSSVMVVLALDVLTVVTVLVTPKIVEE